MARSSFAMAFALCALIFATGSAGAQNAPEYSDPEPGDFSALSWIGAFEAAHEKFSTEYAFTEWKGLDWNDLRAAYAPRIAAAQSAGDTNAYHLAMRDYIAEIPDGHVVTDIEYDTLRDRLFGGSFGIGLAETDSGAVIAAAAKPGSPISAGAEIVEWNGLSVARALEQADARWFGNSATTERLRLARLMALPRGPGGSQVTVRYRNPGDREIRSAILTAAPDAMADIHMVNFMKSPPIGGPDPVVAWRILEPGIGYLSISLLVDLEAPERYPSALRDAVAKALDAMIREGVTRLALDLRGNHGGSDQLAADIAGFFTDKPEFYERVEQFDGRTGRFEAVKFDEYIGTAVLDPAPALSHPQKPRFRGKVAVLVNPSTVSSGEGIAMAVARQPDTAVIGFYGTNGSFGMVGNAIAMPDGVAFSYPHGRSLDADGRVQLDSRRSASGKWVGGVRPTIAVPRTAENLMAHAAGTDVELNHAVAWLAGLRPGAAADAQPPEFRDGDLAAMGWTEAFFATNTLLSRQYGLAMHKKIDFGALAERYAPRIRAAEATGDRDMYRIAMQEYLHEFHDGHFKIHSDVEDLIKRFIGGAFGIGLTALDDGSIIAAAIAPGGSAALAGIPAGAHIVSWNGMPPAIAALGADLRWFRNEANAEAFALRRLQALDRAPIGATVRVSWLPHGASAATVPNNATLAARDDGYAGLALLDLARWTTLEEAKRYVEHRILDPETGYLRIYAESNFDDLIHYPQFIIDAVDRALAEFEAAGVTKIVLDLRANKGGSDQIAADIAGFFYDSPAYYENTWIRDAGRDSFTAAYSDIFTGTLEPSFRAINIVPRSRHFGGRIAVLVNPATVSSGEGIAMAMSRLPNADIIGFNGTHGSFAVLGMPVAMPEGVSFEYVMGVAADYSGRVLIDSDERLAGGVKPSLRVPRTHETMTAFARGEDVELAWAREWLATPSITLEQKIGQMVLMGFSGTAPGDPSVEEARRQIAAGMLGGVILYGYNVVSPEQVKSLNASFATANPLDLALPIAVDQEGGLVQRLGAAKGFADTPSAENVAAEYSPEGAYLIYRGMASMLRDSGITWNFGPVADLRGLPGDPERRPASAVIGALKRAYSEDPAVVSAYAGAFVRAHRDEGIATSLKHFPGHGLASADSHLGLVDITATARAEERLPFRDMIREGLADAVMTAHLVHRGIDPENPVTLSPGYMDRELRANEGFDGAVVTDDLHMGAIQQYHSFEETVIKAIQAGCDILIFSNNPAAARNVPGFAPDYRIAQRVIRVVTDAIATGTLSADRIEASWRRIVALRSRMSR